MSRASFNFERVYAPDPDACLRAYALLLRIRLTPAAHVAPIAPTPTIPAAAHSVQQRRRQAATRRRARKRATP